MKPTIALLSACFLVLPCFAADTKADKRAARAAIDMEAIFKKIDGDNNGKLSKDEFAKLADEVRAKGEKAAKIADRIKAGASDLFTKLDENKDGSLTLEEAKKFEISLLGGAKAAVKDLDATFKKLDKNNDSKLSKDEFAKVGDELLAANPDKAAKIAEKLKPIVEEMFTKLDENKDGNLSAEEFKKFTGLRGERKKAKQTAADGFVFVAADADKAAKKAAKKAKKKAVGNLEATFKKLDTNDDKKLSKEEFAKVADEQKKKANAKAKKADKTKAIIDTAFTKLDENKDGSLSLDEFKKYSGLKGDKKKAK